MKLIMEVKFKIEQLTITLNKPNEELELHIFNYNKLLALTRLN